MRPKESARSNAKHVKIFSSHFRQEIKYRYEFIICTPVEKNDERHVLNCQFALWEIYRSMNRPMLITAVLERMGKLCGENPIPAGFAKSAPRCH